MSSYKPNYESPSISSFDSATITQKHEFSLEYIVKGTCPFMERPPAPPMSTDDMVTGAQGVPFYFSVTDFGRYYDYDMHELIGIIITEYPSKGVIQYDVSNNEWVDVQLGQMIPIEYITNRRLKYFDDAGYGSNYTSFKFKVVDQRSESKSAYQVKINLTSPPIATDDEITASQGDSTVLSLDDFGTFSDEDGGELTTIKITSLPVYGALEYAN